MNRFVVIVTECVGDDQVDIPVPVLSPLGRDELLDAVREFYESFPAVTRDRFVGRRCNTRTRNKRFPVSDQFSFRLSDLEGYQWDGRAMKNVAVYLPPEILTLDEWFAQATAAQAPPATGAQRP